ncbi:MAG: 3'-5' exonuclease [Patescibacteria group bacterium]
MDFLDRPIAVTDTELTGLDPDVHEIIEIGLVLLDPVTLDPIWRYDTKVIPEHIETASPEALKINGYSEEEWRDAIPLRDALEAYSTIAADGVFLAHNMATDWAFMRAGFKKTGVPDRLDYHRIDLFSTAFALLHESELTEFKLLMLARHLGVPEEPLPHRAMGGAECAYQIYRRLMQMSRD